MSIYTYIIALELLTSLGFVPNKRNPRYHHASVTIAGYTVWCKDFRKAQKVAHRVMHFLSLMGYNPRYRVEDEFESYEYNW